MEKDGEFTGSQSHYDFGARIYDGRIGRWLSLDPLMREYSALSAYVFVANSPVILADLDGRDFGVTVNHDPKNPTIIINFTIYAGNFNDVRSGGNRDYAYRRALLIAEYYETLSSTYTVTGDDGNEVVYQVKFDVEVKHEPSQRVQMALKDKEGNSFDVVDREHLKKDFIKNEDGEFILDDKNKKIEIFQDGITKNNTISKVASGRDPSTPFMEIDEEGRRSRSWPIHSKDPENVSETDVHEAGHWLLGSSEFTFKYHNTDNTFMTSNENNPKLKSSLNSPVDFIKDILGQRGIGTSGAKSKNSPGDPNSINHNGNQPIQFNEGSFSDTKSTYKEK